MLKKVYVLDYSANYAYAPPKVEALINTDEIVSATPTDARGSGPFMLVRFRDGSNLTVVGTVDALLPNEMP